jgi:anaerobic C4-dicarboxylate transporter
VSVVKPLLLVALIGFLVWVLLAFVPMPYPFGTILVIVAVVLAIVVLLRAAGLWDSFRNS